MPAARSRASRGGLASPVVVVVVSDQEMIADTIATALTGLGVAARPGSWGGSPEGGPGGAPPAAVGVVVIESPEAEGAAAFAALVAGGSAEHWIVLIAAARSSEWTAVLSGVTVVLPRSSALDDVVEAVRALAAGGEPS